MALIQKNEGKARALGLQLRQSSSVALRRRRGIFGLFLTASASMSVVALYQLGILRRLPDPPARRFNSNRATGSAKAYALVETPDAVLALGSYAATMTLIAMGSPNRASEQPLLPIALAAKVGLDVFIGSKYAVQEWQEHRNLCFWCLLALAAMSASAILAVPEAHSAFQQLKTRSREPL